MRHALSADHVAQMLGVSDRGGGRGPRAVHRSAGSGSAPGAVAGAEAVAQVGRGPRQHQASGRDERGRGALPGTLNPGASPAALNPEASSAALNPRASSAMPRHTPGPSAHPQELSHPQDKDADGFEAAASHRAPLLTGQRGPWQVKLAALHLLDRLLEDASAASEGAAVAAEASWSVAVAARNEPHDCTAYPGLASPRTLGLASPRTLGLSLRSIQQIIECASTVGSLPAGMLERVYPSILSRLPSSDIQSVVRRSHTHTPALSHTRTHTRGPARTQMRTQRGRRTAQLPFSTFLCIQHLPLATHATQLPNCSSPACWLQLRGDVAEALGG